MAGVVIQESERWAIRITLANEMPRAFQPFRVAAARSMALLTMPAKAVAGGVPQSTAVRTLGASTWATVTAMCTGAATLRITGSQFVASGIIKLFDSFDYLIIWGMQNYFALIKIKHERQILQAYK